MKPLSFVASIVFVLLFVSSASAALNHNRNLRVSQTDFVSCAVLQDGRVKCWGRLDHECRDCWIDRSNAVTVNGVNHAYDIHVGRDMVCAQERLSWEAGADSWVSCWSYAGGVGTWVDDELFGMSYQSEPFRVSELNGTLQLAFGDKTYCALSEEGDVRCWGFMFDHPHDWYRLTPKIVPGIVGAEKIAVNNGAVCALLGNGQVTCARAVEWTPDLDPDCDPAVCEKPYLGPDKPYAYPPITVPGIGPVRDISADAAIFNAVLRDGTVWRWTTRRFFSERSADDNLYWSSCEPLVETVNGITEAEIIVGGSGTTTCVIERGGKGSCWGWTFVPTMCGSEYVFDAPIYLQNAGPVRWISGMDTSEERIRAGIDPDDSTRFIEMNNLCAEDQRHNLLVYEPTSGDWRPLFDDDLARR